MPRRPHSSSTTLKTIQVSPLVLARETVRSGIAQLRANLAMARQVAASIRSVELVADDVAISYVPTVIDGRSLLRIPVGEQDIGVRLGVSVQQAGGALLLGLQLDAHVLERMAPRPLGKLVAQASCHLNTQVRVVLTEVIEGEALPAPAARRRRLKQG